MSGSQIEKLCSFVKRGWKFAFGVTEPCRYYIKGSKTVTTINKDSKMSHLQVLYCVCHCHIGVSRGQRTSIFSFHYFCGVAQWLHCGIWYTRFIKARLRPLCISYTGLKIICFLPPAYVPLFPSHLCTTHKVR